MPLTKIKSLGITDGTIIGDDINSTFNLTGKTVTLPAGTGGKVLQVVSTTYSTTMTTTSGSYADMNLSLNITPSSASNKILILVSTSHGIYGGGTDAGGGINVLRDSTVINGGSGYILYSTDAGGGADVVMQYQSSTLDSPNTTSIITYKCQFAAYYGGTFAVHRGLPSYLIAMEIAA